MRRRGEGGAIVNVLSMSAHGGQPYLAPYVASKSALIGLTRNAAFAHRWDRIRINGLNIGWTQTEGEDAIQRQFHGAEDGWEAQAAKTSARWASSDRSTRSPTSSCSSSRHVRRGHGIGHRLGPGHPGRLRVAPGGPDRLAHQTNGAHMRIGLIGLGRIGAFHARTLRDYQTSRSSSSPMRCRPPCARRRCRAVELGRATVVDNPDELFAHGVDGVVIASSTPTHAELIRTAWPGERRRSARSRSPSSRRRLWPCATSSPAPACPCRSGFPGVSTGLPDRPRAGAVRAAWATCTRFGRPPSTRPAHRRLHRGLPAGSSTTAPSTTSTRCGGRRVRRSSRSWLWEPTRESTTSRPPATPTPRPGPDPERWHARCRLQHPLERARARRTPRAARHAGLRQPPAWMNALPLRSADPAVSFPCRRAVGLLPGPVRRRVPC